MQAIKVGAHSYYVQGEPGAASAENQGFMSNAGFVVGDDGVLYAGDLVFAGRVPFVGEADGRLWLASLYKLTRLKPEVLVPSHGRHSNKPAEDLKLTRDYLTYLRQQMGRAVADFVPFEDAYAKTDWSEFEILPAFADANRGNAYNTYLLMERELLEKR